MVDFQSLSLILLYVNYDYDKKPLRVEKEKFIKLVGINKARLTSSFIVLSS